MYQNIDDDDDIDPYQASSFYGFSFIELSDSSEDSWSVNSSNTVSVIENVSDKEENNQCSNDLSTIDSISLDYNLLNQLFTK
ncbi:unnamed protein product [Rotaria magnacalcarata]|uniref:Uncharacterized protein n=2 Tax=Rotaria magnacalcarata TaxID=392030 RepID=A0A820HA07_9BILA|nr:unnamed protein product [Rotaria magnacalcarata]CAF4548275.1 unnamed protein product [Rotaria magnacalcarata]